ILAILTTVSVVGYTSFIEKANRSVDEQAVAQMNTALIAGNIPDGQFRSIHDVIEFLDGCDLSIEDYKPLSKGKYFFWDSVSNRIIYTDSNYTVLAPEGIETHPENWYSLTGQIEGLSKADADAYFATAVSTETTWTIEVSTKEQMYALSQNFNALVNNANSNGKTITIEIANDINFMGASIAFWFDNVDKGTLIIRADSEVVLSNIAQTNVSILSDSNTDGELRSYYGGIVPYASQATAGVGKSPVVKFENITLKNCSFGAPTIGSVAAFVGAAGSGAASVSFTNCKVEDCHLIGKNKVAPFVGNAGGNEAITFSGCSATGNRIYAEEGAVCQIIGLWYEGADASGVTVSNNTTSWAAGSLPAGSKYEASRVNGALWTYNSDYYTPVLTK
ncbi:MAG: hypothetical protein IKC52_02140, partial [Clostridia bacterium]|nr:hypothetical protein [Clostridia bacterium]